jgi:hypothetical protein
MIYWNRHFKGGIASYIRSKINVNAAVENPSEPFKIENNQNIDFRQLVAKPLSDVDLSPSASAIVDAFLHETAAVFIRSKKNRQLYGLIEAPLAPEVASNLIHSDEACSALDDACDELPIEEVVASNWFVRQIAQSIGQEMVGSEPQLSLVE